MKRLATLLLPLLVSPLAQADIVFDLMCQSTTGNIQVELSLGGADKSLTPVSDFNGMSMDADSPYSVWAPDQYKAQIDGNRIEVSAKDESDTRMFSVVPHASFSENSILLLWEQANKGAAIAQTTYQPVTIQARNVPVVSESSGPEMITTKEAHCIITVEPNPPHDEGGAEG